MALKTIVYVPKVKDTQTFTCSYVTPYVVRINHSCHKAFIKSGCHFIYGHKRVNQYVETKTDLHCTKSSPIRMYEKLSWMGQKLQKLFKTQLVFLWIISINLTALKSVINVMICNKKLYYLAFSLKGSGTDRKIDISVGFTW